MDNGVSVLESMRLCPSCGSAHFDVHEGAGRRCRDCGYTLFCNPSSAAAVFLINPEGHVLAFRRERQPSQGKWAIPGGFLDAGEAFEAAAIREAREEVGLEVHSVSYLTSWPNQYVYRGILYHVVDTYFTCRDFSGNITAQAGEVGKWAWLDPQQIAEEDWAFPSLRHAVRCLTTRHS